jgi:hypothetical protein
MDVNTAKKLIETLIQEATIEINSIKSQVVGEIVMQVAIYSHDHVGAHRMAFGVLSDSPNLDKEHLEELEEMKAVLLDREQRRNALKHLMRLIEEGNEEALQLLQKELLRCFSEGETYEFLLAPESEYPNEYVKPYPYAE